MNNRRLGRVIFAATAAFLVLAPVALSAQSDERRRAIGDWLVEDASDEAGNSILRISRESGDYRLDYHLNLASGFPGEFSQGFLVWRLNCGQGIEEGFPAGAAGVDPAAVRRRIEDYLGRCGTPQAEAAELMRDFDRGMALLAQWATERQARWGSAENAADAAEAAADSMELNMTDDMGMADMNYTADEESRIYENATDVPEAD